MSAPLRWHTPRNNSHLHRRFIGIRRVSCFWTSLSATLASSFHSLKKSYANNDDSETVRKRTYYGCSIGIVERVRWHPKRYTDDAMSQPSKPLRFHRHYCTHALDTRCPLLLCLQFHSGLMLGFDTCEEAMSTDRVS